MSPHDQTRKSIAKLRRAVAAGKLSAAVAAPKIAALEKKGPRWVARWDGGTRVCRTLPEAKKLESQNRALASLGERSVPKLLRITMSQIFAWYLNGHLKGKPSFPNARSHFEKADAIIGSITLAKLDAHADKLLGGYLEKLGERFPAIRAEATAFNHLVYVRAAVNRYIRKNRLRVVNPFQVLEVVKPHNVRKRTPSFSEYRDLLAESQRAGYPKWLATFYVLLWEHGRRLSEYAALKWEDVELNPPGEEAPFMRILSLKQGRGRREISEIPLFLPAAQAFLHGRPAPPTGPVFASSVYVLEYWHRLAREAVKVQDLGIHDFRRAFKNRYQAVNPSLRDPMQAHTTRETAENYITDRRHALEAVVSGSYMGDFREFKKGIEVSV